MTSSDKKKFQESSDELKKVYEKEIEEYTTKYGAPTKKRKKIQKEEDSVLVQKKPGVPQKRVALQKPLKKRKEE